MNLTVAQINKICLGTLHNVDGLSPYDIALYLQRVSQMSIMFHSQPVAGKVFMYEFNDNSRLVYKASSSQYGMTIDINDLMNTLMNEKFAEMIRDGKRHMVCELADGVII